MAEERAAKVFQQLDVNDDGELNEEEFVFGALKVWIAIISRLWAIFQYFLHFKDATLTALISGDATGWTQNFVYRSLFPQVWFYHTEAV